MPHSHYVMDSYYSGDNSSTQMRREVMRIVAADDAAAVLEAERLDQWKRSTFYDVRSIRGAARTGDRLIYSSRAEEQTPTAAT